MADFFTGRNQLTDACGVTRSDVGVAAKSGQRQVSLKKLGTDDAKFFADQLKSVNKFFAQ